MVPTVNSMLTPDQLDILPITLYEFRIRAREETILPPFLGTTLRGAFGNALKSIVCSVAHGECHRCLLVERCLYPQLFETTARVGNGLLPASDNSRRPFVNISPLRKEGQTKSQDYPHGGSGLICRDVPPWAPPTRFAPARGGAPTEGRPYKSGPHPHGPYSNSSPLQQEENRRTDKRQDDAPRTSVYTQPHREEKSRADKRPSDAPRPFIFVPPLPRTDTGALRARDDLLRWRVRVNSDQPVVFGLYLLGPAIPELPYVIHAINTMAHNGIGAERARFVLDEVAVLHVNGAREVIYTPADAFVRTHDQSSTLGALVRARLEELKLAAARDQGRAIRLRFLTPTRLRIKGQVVEQPSFAQLIRLLSLRLSMVAQTHGAAPLTYDYRTMLQRAEKVSTSKSNLNLLALERRSNRQDRKLDIDGFTGEIVFTGDGLSEFLPLLLAGEFLHVGSGTAFGLGRYEVMSEVD